MCEFSFKEYDQLKNVIPIDIAERNADFIYEYFMENKEDILYIMRKDKLAAIASPGDVHKFYIGRGGYKFAYNEKFSFLDEIDYDKASVILDKIPTIHEVPVIQGDKFIGVITNHKCKQETEWQAIRNDLQRVKHSRRHTEWLCEDLILWKKFFPNVKLLIYYIPSDKYLMPRVLEIVRQRRAEWYEGKYDVRLETEKREGFTRLPYETLCLNGKNGVYKLNDVNTETCKVSQGYRNVPNAGTNELHKIFLFGPCTIFGAYVDDFSTIEYFLQDRINGLGKSYQVCNCGHMGLSGCWHRMFVEKMKENDIVVLALREEEFPYCYLHTQIRKDFQSDWSLLNHQVIDAEKNFLDMPAHCNRTMNDKIADVIFEDIKEFLSDSESGQPRVAMQDYYIDFQIRDYFEDYVKKYKKNIKDSSVIGSVVMNCNPFTLGHRHLIEKALEKVDYLYIFVVEEDKSVFKFDDRIAMVRKGVEDLDRICVIPSGRYIISRDTFEQYFDKENINVNDIGSMDFDVRIFGEIVAPGFGISYRFVGEEPSDNVTNAYNITLKEILPQYGVRVIEIPRKNVTGEEELISATKARKLFQQGGYAELNKYCPESTILYLKDKIQ